MSQTARPKYRSAIRDAPRILTPLNSNRVLLVPQSATGILEYQVHGEPFTKIKAKSTTRNAKAVRKRYGAELRHINQAFDCIYRLASQYFYLFTSPIGAEISPVNEILFPIFHKTLLSLSTAQDLTATGLYGPARPLMRHSYESLLIAKLCSTDNSSDVFDKWVDGKEVYLSNAVLKRIVSPSTEELSRFWGVMSDFSHSSIYAMQEDFSLTDEVMDQIAVNCGFIWVLLECSHHLLSRHIITASMRYYRSRYGDETVAKKAHTQLKDLFAAYRSTLGSGLQRLAKDYRSAWKVRNS